MSLFPTGNIFFHGSVMIEMFLINIEQNSPFRGNRHIFQLMAGKLQYKQCGPDYQKAMDDYDLVMKSPGIVLEKPVGEYKAEILSQMQLIFEVYRDRIIGITGTKGKSTTTSLRYERSFWENSFKSPTASSFAPPASKNSFRVDLPSLPKPKINTFLFSVMRAARRISGAAGAPNVSLSG